MVLIAIDNLVYYEVNSSNTIASCSIYLSGLTSNIQDQLTNMTSSINDIYSGMSFVTLDKESRLSLTNDNTISGVNNFENEVIIKNQYINSLISINTATYTLSTPVRSSYFVDNYTQNVLIMIPLLSSISNGTVIHFAFNCEGDYSTHLSFQMQPNEYMAHCINNLNGQNLFVCDAGMQIFSIMIKMIIFAKK